MYESWNFKHVPRKSIASMTSTLFSASVTFSRDIYSFNDYYSSLSSLSSPTRRPIRFATSISCIYDSSIYDCNCWDSPFFSSSSFFIFIFTLIILRELFLLLLLSLKFFAQHAAAAINVNGVSVDGRRDGWLLGKLRRKYNLYLFETLGNSHSSTLPLLLV